MKIKRVLTVVFVMLLAVCLVGCGQTNTEAAVASNIEKSTSKLTTIIEKLDEINYDDIIIEDISPLADSTFKTTTQTKALQKSKWYAVGTGQSGTYQTSKIAGNRRVPNAKYVSTDKIEIERAQNRTRAKYADRISQTKCDNGDCYEYNNEYGTQRTNVYKPKYVNQVSNSFTRDSLDNYLSQIEVLYNTCADCVSCNAECKNQTTILMQNIADCKVLSEKLKDGTIKLTEPEIASCNTCLDELQACSYKLNSTKENVTIKEKDVSKLKDNFSKNLTMTQEAYSKLLTAIESRLDYLKSCNNCIYSLCDIINKTNVNVAAAEKNKSNQEDIMLNEERLQEENEDRMFENGILDTNEYSAYQTKASKTYQNNNLRKTQNGNIAQKNPFRDNHKVEIAEKEQNVQNGMQKKTTLDKQQNNENSMPNTMPNENPNIYNQYPSNPQNNYNQNGYYGQYPYGYRPYPPRNIDTYRNVIKNTDTYSPNYMPGNGTNTIPNNGVYSNPSENYNSQNLQTVNAEVEQSSIDENKTNDSKTNNTKPSGNNEFEIPKTEALHSSQSSNNVSKFGENHTTMQKNSNNNHFLISAMQTANLNSKFNLSAEEDISEPIIVENELY